MKKFLLITLLLVVVGVAAYLLICNFTYSEGSRTGYLIKFSRSGFVFKTYEGEMNLGGMNTAGIPLPITSGIFRYYRQRRMW
jgi:hypothetical protein